MNTSQTRTETLNRTIALSDWLKKNYANHRDRTQKQIAETARHALNNPTITHHHVSQLLIALNLRPAFSPGPTPDNPKNNWMVTIRNELLRLESQISDLSKRMTALEDAFK